MPYRVLITESLANEGREILSREPEIEIVEKALHKPDELSREIGDFDALIVRSSTKVTAQVIDAGTRLRVVGRAGIGVDNIDVTAASRRGIIVMNTPGGNNVTTAEHAISLMLASARWIPQANASLRAGKWERSKFTGSEVTGKTLGVVGLGNIGRIVADRGRGLKMNVIAYDPFLTADAALRLEVEPVSLDELLSRADFVTIHVPLTNDTRNLLDAKRIAQMKRGARVINCARGGIVDEAALAEALQSGRIAGAAFDVFTEEPPPADHPLVKLPQVVATPHLGASTDEAQTNVAIAIAEQVAAFLTRGTITAAVNMPSVTAEQLTVLRPFIDLGEKLGSLVGQLSALGQTAESTGASIGAGTVHKGAPVEVQIDYRGDVTEHGTATVTAAVLRGLLVPILGSELNYVSAPAVARERGIQVIESRTSELSDFRNRIGVKVRFASGATHDVAGAVFSGKIIRLVKLDDFFLEAVPEGNILMLHNRDVPGVVGHVGTLLARHSVNIAGLQLGRERAGGRAVSLFHVDETVPAAVLEELRKAPEILSAALIRL